jgi:hypothetical protein
LQKELEHFGLGLKMLKFFEADADPGSGIFMTLDPGSVKEKIPDPQP